MIPFNICTFVDVREFSRTYSQLLVPEIPIHKGRSIIVEHLRRLRVGQRYNIPGRMLTESSVLVWCQHPAYSAAIVRVVAAISAYEDGVHNLTSYYNAVEKLGLVVNGHTEIVVPPVYDRNDIYRTFGV